MGRTTTLRLACLAALFLAAACASPPGPPPTPGDCAMIRLWSNGWHVNLAIRAELFSDENPVRALFPEARYFLIGWGERDFYMAEDAGFWKGLKAAIPPGPAVMQVIANDAPVEETIWPGRTVATLALSETGARRLAQSIGAYVMREETGAPIVLGRGRIADKSVFLAARGNFHLFNMCNHWTAARLREAGVPVRARISFTAGGLMRAAKRKAPTSCPAEG
ncbi:MAG: DUF2459 domain-containing protein [Amphiplicatus sp.]